MNKQFFFENQLSKNQIFLLGESLKMGKIAVLPTDTIYGICTSALNPISVERIYKLRKRSQDKPMIILISSIGDLEKFDIHLSPKQTQILKSIWPNPVSVILPCSNVQFSYLHRGKKSLAFRVPQHLILQQILSISGPLVAPSANFEGEKPSLTIDEAKNYFSINVDFYIDAGVSNSISSTLIDLQNDQPITIRQGEYQIQNI